MEINKTDIQGPNLIPCVLEITGGTIGFDLEWNVLTPESGVERFIDENGEVTIRRRITRERAQEWLNVLQGQLDRAPQYEQMKDDG